MKKIGKSWYLFIIHSRKGDNIRVSENKEAFCPYCECHHKPSSTIRCAFNRALNKFFGDNI